MPCHVACPCCYATKKALPGNVSWDVVTRLNKDTKRYHERKTPEIPKILHLTLSQRHSLHARFLRFLRSYNTPANRPPSCKSFTKGCFGRSWGTFVKLLLLVERLVWLDIRFCCELKKMKNSKVFQYSKNIHKRPRRC